MTFYTEKGSPSFNRAREVACLSLEKTLVEMHGEANVTELMFRDRWLDNMRGTGDVLADGWYSPPPKGAAVLTNDRVNFDSLRNPYNWSDDTEIYWNGVLYAYASPIDRESGYIGDISVTLYFGRDNKIIDHVKRCHEATMAVFERLGEAETAGELFRISQSIFEQYHLKSTVISRTDDMPINLGHTFPFLTDVQQKETLSEDDKLTVSRSRKFLNAGAQWGFEDDLQFTVEPQLVSVDDPSLPKITQHYVVQAKNGNFTVCNDIDRLLEKYSLI